MTLAEELNELLPAKWYTSADPTCARLNIVGFFYVVRVNRYGEQYTVTMVTPSGNATSNPVSRERLASSITHFTSNVCVFARLFSEAPVIPEWAQDTYNKQIESFNLDDTQ